MYLDPTPLGGQGQRQNCSSLLRIYCFAQLKGFVFSKRGASYCGVCALVYVCVLASECVNTVLLKEKFLYFYTWALFSCHLGLCD